MWPESCELVGQMRNPWHVKDLSTFLHFLVLLSYTESSQKKKLCQNQEKVFSSKFPRKEKWVKKKKIQCLLNWLVKLLGFPYNGRRFPATGDTTAASRQHGGDQGRSRPAAESVVVSWVRPEFEMGKDYCLGLVYWNWDSIIFIFKVLVCFK